MGDTPQSHANNAQIASEQATCLQLRIDGLTFRAIASATGLSLGTVYNRVAEAIAAEIHPKADELRTIESERLDQYLSRLQPKIADGDDRAINTAVRISESRRKMLGLDMPTRMEASIESREVIQADLELQQMIRDAQAAVDAEQARIIAGEES